MKKELFAGIILTTLILTAFHSITQIKTLSNAISEQLITAEQACIISNFESAESALHNGIQIWMNADKYTHIFIRHSEIDATSDALYDALTDIKSQTSSAIYTIEKAKYHLNSIYSMEKPTIKNIF